jgi:predicted dehydrogenase
MTRIGVIGAGRWGVNHLRVLSDLQCEIIGIADTDVSKKQLALDYAVQFKTDYREILPLVDAVILATPASTHFQICSDCLLAGKHVLVEKPFSMDYLHSRRLVQIARKNKLKLAVGHLYRFNPALIRLKKEIRNINDLKYANLRYANYNQHAPVDCSVIFDYGSHLIDMALFLWEENPRRIYCKHYDEQVSPEKTDSAVILLIYSSFIVSLEQSWFQYGKYRDALIIARDSAIVTDFLNQTMVRYDIKSSIEKKIISCRTNIKLTRNEPLKEEVINFIKCIDNDLEPINSGDNACEVVRLCELAIESSKTGCEISL